MYVVTIRGALVVQIVAQTQVAPTSDKRRQYYMEPKYIKMIITQGWQGPQARYTRAQLVQVTEAAETNKCCFQERLGSSEILSVPSVHKAQCQGHPQDIQANVLRASDDRKGRILRELVN